MKDKLVNLPLDHPIKVIIGVLIFVVLAASGAQNLVFKGDYRIFFSEDNPQLTEFESMQRVFAKSENVAFVLAPKNGDIFTPENLDALYWLTEESWQIPYSSRVDSITNYQHTIAEEDDLLVEDLVLDPEVLASGDMDRLRDIAVNEPLLRNKLISEGGHVAIVSANVHLPGVNEQVEVPEVAAAVREIEKDFLERYPDFEVYLSGIVMLNTSFTESALNDSATLVPLMFVLVIVAMSLLLRTITGTVATLVVIVTSIVATMGTFGWLGFYLSGPTASVPTIVLTLAVADCVHILSTMFFKMRQGVEKREALHHSLHLNFQPIFLTSLTTAIGFLSMLASDSPPFRDLGMMVAYGVMLAFVFSLTIFPALLMKLPVRVKQKPEGQADLMDRFAEFVIRNRKMLLPGMSVLVIGFVAMVPLNQLNDDFVKYFHQSVPFRQATDFMQDNVSGIGTLDVAVNSGDQSGINEVAYLKALADFSSWLLEQPETDHVITLTDTIKRLNRSMHGDDQSYYRLPDSRELSAQYLLMYEMSLPYGLDLNNQLDVDKSSTRITITLKNVTSNEQIDIENRIKAWFADNAPDYNISVASPNLMFAHIGQRNITSMLLGTSIALLLISGLLGIALRSVRYGLISLIPNLAPAAVGFGLWYVIDGQIGLALSVVAGMTLGIVVDDTVHFMSKYKYARDNISSDATESVRYAFRSVGRALWVTTLVLVAGFMVLAQSSFKLNSDMGLLTALTIAIALIIDFLLLPPLLIKLDGDGGEKKAVEKSPSMTPALDAGV
ncbi:MAG: efflux RND transporter permease subunit [Pseudomonadota bacterium]